MKTAFAERDRLDDGARCTEVPHRVGEGDQRNVSGYAGEQAFDGLRRRLDLLAVADLGGGDEEER